MNKYKKILDNLKDLENASLEYLREGIVLAQNEIREWCAFESKVQAEMDKRMGSVVVEVDEESEDVTEGLTKE